MKTKKKINPLSRPDFDALLYRLGACYEAQDWLNANPSLTPEQVWARCERLDWLLWLAGRVEVDRRAIVLAECDCAELTAPYWTEDSILACVWAIDVARRWVLGEAEIEEMWAARSAVYAAYAVTDVAAAAAAAAAYAAYAANATDATDATDAANAYARTGVERECCDLIRVRIPWTMIKAAIAVMITSTLEESNAMSGS